MTVDRKGYAFSKEELRVIGGFYVLPLDVRLEEMKKFFTNKDPVEIMEMFSNFIDMAETVIENTREQCQLILLCSGMSPTQAEKFNEPSILGAIRGFEAAKSVRQDSLCHGCAFRRGSVANTCLVTVDDAEYCSDNDKTFMCHENLDDSQQPTQKCRGFLIKEKQNAKI